jgi:class 3 adenylate cyclase
VTVLFADVVGSTAMARAWTPRTRWPCWVPRCGAWPTSSQAHQGRVLRFTGDGVKAAFGMDAAREDDAERAVRAGLAILQAGRVQAGQARRQHGIADFAVRVGVHTGDVALGAGVEADNTAMGAAVNIAARMEQSAPPGTLRISHDTWSQVRGLFDMQPQPPCRSRASKRRCRPTWCAPRWTAVWPASSAGCKAWPRPWWAATPSCSACCTPWRRRARPGSCRR